MNLEFLYGTVGYGSSTVMGVSQFNPWPRTFCIPQVWQKIKKKREEFMYFALDTNENFLKKDFKKM